MLEQDYIMRQIKEIVRTVLKLIFNIEADSPSAQLMESREERTLLEELIKLADRGRVLEAENSLEGLIEGGKSSLMLELLFYSHLNGKTDSFLETCRFSREKIRAGIGRTMDRYGLSDLAEMLLSDL